MILQETRGLYHLLLPRIPEGVAAQQDVVYAQDERQTLDLYTPAEAGDLPVLIYVPGGGFTGGDKRGEDGFYDNIGYDFAGHGFLVVVMNYRLAPQHSWPAGGEDVSHAVAWARERAAAYGGNPDRIAIFGRSAPLTS